MDLVEQSPKLIGAAREFVASPKLEHLYTAGLQEFIPAPDTYDLIWVQWVVGHLTDADLVQFLLRCGRLCP